MDLRAEREHKRASWILHAWRSAESLGLLQRHPRLEEVQLRGKTVPADSQIPAGVLERSRPEKLFQHSREDRTKGSHVVIVPTHFCSPPVVEDHYNPRLVKELLQDLSATLHSLTLHVGRCVLVGNVNVWLRRLENILKWQRQLNDLQIPKQMCSGTSFSDLPLYMHNKILYNLSDACDIINLGQATPTLHILSENRTLWKRLCHFHFSDKQHVSRNVVLPKSDSLDWKLMYFALQKRFPMKEQYGDTLHFCKHCSVLFWKDCGHPCTANDPDGCLVPISPQHFIDLFRF
ncbi:F-box only protein 25 isoform X2 [Syngnathoides biaculeatus]|uniref:F-box only protein 25 isoform X2 n=1 Tax=Syngnathoides biaculeatus TaxID=300417 RepID=UPI002ADD9E44|nr:F-box only protein 25 isoform X2 [Syngnathoides biaculeatus]